LAYFEGGTAEQYGALGRALADAPVPPERRVFVAGPAPGGWQVVQVWDSKDALDVFNREWFLPALGRAGSRGFQGAPEVRDFHADDFWIGTERIS
jgi:hypothetical protein